MKPIIGLVPLIDEEKESYWMLPGYMQGIAAAGGLPVMLPLSNAQQDIRQVLQCCSGLLFTGGHDVSPALYGQRRLAVCGACCPARDAMEKALLCQALEMDMPVLGICRGAQLFNAVLGGTLYQDIPTQLSSAVTHQQKPPYHVPAHTVQLIEGTPLQTLLQLHTLPVNSYHHQGIAQLSARLKSMAASADGLVEAVYLPGQKFAWAIQWHPEFSYETDPNSQKIFKAFVDACR